MVQSTAGNAASPVAILLSVYNGEAFLNRQLDSIIEQTHGDWVLYWRDDQSSDASRAIMLSFQKHRGQGRAVEISGPLTRLGVAASYMALLDAVPPGRMIAFADQDDVWIPEKLAWGAAALASRPDEPALYCARQYLTDPALTVRSESPSVRRLPDFATALTQNIATGHTVMLNVAAHRMLQGGTPPPGVLHDWWAYLVISAVGGAIMADQRCVSYYRQHQRNTVGSRSWSARAVAAVRRGPHAFMQIFRANIEALSADCAPMTPEARDIVAEVRAALDRGLLGRAALLWRRRDLVRQSASETAMFRLWFILSSGR